MSTMPKDSTSVAVISALTSLVVTTLTLSWQFFKSQQDRRRQLYSEAYKVVMSWHEMYYRISRRTPKSKSAQEELVKKFHDLQESVDYFTGWMKTESSYLGKLYSEFASETKALTEDPVRLAWEKEPLSPQKPWPINSRARPNKSALGDTFLSAVRDHLSLNPLRKTCYGWRVVKEKIGRGF